MAYEERPFEITIKVIFRDIDALGHVNNAVYFTYLETARTSFFAERMQWTEPENFPVIVAEATCTYLAPLHMGERVNVQLGVGRIARRSFDFVYSLVNHSGLQVARAKTAMVTYDYTRHKAIPIPDDLLIELRSAQGPKLAT
jgi:acyl-CoA thioester hydrolase